MTSALIPSTERTSLTIAGTPLAVPARTAKLLFISHDPPPVHRSGLGVSISIHIYDGHIDVENISPDEPSTIYTAMPIRRPTNPDLTPRPDYYPSYAGLSMDQKWIYLRWLTDITQTINIGYVFIYYYGLERHLLIGDFDDAFDEILLLRQTHSDNSSFESYSRSALLNSALFRKQRHRLEQLYRLSPPEHFEDTDLILAHQLGYDLGSEGLTRLSSSLRGIQKRYIKTHPAEYKLALDDVLIGEFGRPFLPFASLYSISEVPKQEHLLFANISFPSEIRTPPLPSFLGFAPFIQEATRVMALAHERTK
jgi:TerB N-terminal domain